MSTSSKRSKRSVRLSVRLGFFMAYGFIKCLPHWLWQPVVAGLAHSLYAVAGRARRISLSNLRQAFGDQKSLADLTDIARRSFVSFLTNTIGIISYDRQPNKIHAHMEFNDKALIDSLLSHGRGLVIVTAHYGHFQLMMFRLALEGYKVNTIINPLRDYQVDEFFAQGAMHNGVNLIPSIPGRVCVIEAYKALERNEIVVILPDQNFGGRTRVFIDMFGKLAGTATSPVSFAAKSGAPLLPLFTTAKGDHWSIVCDQPIHFESNAADEGCVAQHMQHITGIIERYIRQHPDHWLWMHNRFKTVPTEKEMEKLS